MQTFDDGKGDDNTIGNGIPTRGHVDVVAGTAVDERPVVGYCLANVKENFV